MINHSLKGIDPRPVVRAIAALSIVLAGAGCGNTPRLYTMDPIELENTRSQWATVGVDLAPTHATTEVLLPAKGAWGGAKRGVVLGATLPVMIGFVSPIPGGTALGVLLAPLGALVGGVYGVSTALPEQEVADAEAILTSASDELRGLELSNVFLNRVVELGNRSTNLRFYVWHEGQHGNADRGGGRRQSPAAEAMDTKLAIQVLTAGLRGQYHIDPPMDIFLEVRVRLIRMHDDAILLDEYFTCASDEERLFKAWSAQGGVLMIREFQSCMPELAEKIVEDIFRVYPMQWKQGE